MAFKSFPKPERAERKAKKKTAAGQFTRTRRQACDIVWRREGGTKDRHAHCQRCRRDVSRDVAAWKDERAQFNETTPRSLGGDPTDPACIELTCRACHFGGPSGAHAPTAARMTKQRSRPVTSVQSGDRMKKQQTEVFRQGDVVVKRTRQAPSAAAKPITDKGRTILAYGEVTGHCHEVIAPSMPGVDHVPSQQLFEEPDGTRLLVLKHDGELRHDEHDTIALGKGTYEVIRQREYAPEGLRNVAD